MDDEQIEFIKSLPFGCVNCDRRFNHINALLTHVSRTYGLTSEQYYCEINNIKAIPLCECGCGEKVFFHTFTTGYWKYLKGHATDGSSFTEESRKKAAEVYRQNLASGKTVRKKKPVIIDSFKQFKCPECPYSYDMMLSLARHWTRGHKFSTENLYLKFNNLTEAPKCPCDCGETLTFLDCVNGYRKYFGGHRARVENNYQMERVVKKSLETRRQMLKDGTWKPFVSLETGEMWSKGLTKETDERIAKMAASINNNPEEILRRSKQMKEHRENGTISTLYGSEHSQWKGGISSIVMYCYNNKKLYNEWKFVLLKKSGFKCEVCDSIENLHVHHDGIKMNDIVREIVKINNFNIESIYKNSDKVSIETKELIGELVAEYHIKNNVSGKVLCETCHKKEHNSLNF